MALPSASHRHGSDAVSALNDQVEPKDSCDQTIPRFTWWDHKGTAEWVQYDFDEPVKVSAVEVYWFDDERIKRHCRAAPVVEAPLPKGRDLAAGNRPIRLRHRDRQVQPHHFQPGPDVGPEDRGATR